MRYRESVAKLSSLRKRALGFVNTYRDASRSYHLRRMNQRRKFQRRKIGVVLRPPGGPVFGTKVALRRVILVIAYTPLSFARF